MRFVVVPEATCSQPLELFIASTDTGPDGPGANPQSLKMPSCGFHTLSPGSMTTQLTLINSQQMNSPNLGRKNVREARADIDGSLFAKGAPGPVATHVEPPARRTFAVFR